MQRDGSCFGCVEDPKGLCFATMQPRCDILNGEPCAYFENTVAWGLYPELRKKTKNDGRVDKG